MTHRDQHIPVKDRMSEWNVAGESRGSAAQCGSAVIGQNTYESGIELLDSGLVEVVGIVEIRRIA